MEFSELVEHTRTIGVPRHLKLQSEAHQYNQSVQQDTYQIFTEIIEYAQANNIRMVFFTPPYFSTYTELYGAETIATMKRNMKQLQATYGIEYYDFSMDPAFIYANQLFTDDDHLTQCGAKLFSAKLKTTMGQSAPETGKNDQE